jgi:flagellar biosynthesis anti-sigma factor FlgM
MKIDPRIQFPSDAPPDRVKNASKGAAEAQSAANPSGVSPAAGEDTVKLSSTHNEVQTLAASLNHVPEVRTSRVHALQQRVESGQYNPASQQVADAIIKDHSRVSTKA